MFNFCIDLSTLPISPNAPHTNDDTSNPREKGHVVRGLVAGEPVRTISVSILVDNGVKIVNDSVKQVENITAKHRRESHHTEVLRKTINTESVSGQRRENAEEEAVGDSSESRDNGQLVWVHNRGARKLCERKNHRRQEQAPKSGHVKFLDKDIRSNT